MRKITFVTRSLQSGGAEHVISQLANYFVNNGWVCQMVTMYKDVIFYELDSKIEVIQIDENLVNGTLKDKIVRYKKLRDIIKKSGTDIVLAMPEDIGIYVIAAMIGTGIPVVVSERNNPWLMPYNKVSRFLRRVLYPIADGLIFQTHEAASFFSKALRTKGLILPNPLDLNRIPEPYHGKREKKIVSIGRLTAQKNFELLINAFEEFWINHRDYDLIIYGEGEYRSQLEQLIKSKEARNNIYLPGRDSNVLEKIKNASLFVLSSDYEGVPNALIEAMSIGLPCISTDCEPGGAREIITDNFDGIVVPPGNVEKLKGAIERMIDDDNLATIYSIRAGEVRNRFDINKVGDMWAMYLKEIINS